MNCEWHGYNRTATWWAESIYGPMSWCCDDCLKRVGKMDADGKYIAIPASEQLKRLHPE